MTDINTIQERGEVMEPTKENPSGENPAEVKVRDAIVEYLATLGINYYDGYTTFKLKGNVIQVTLLGRGIEYLVKTDNYDKKQ